MKKFFLAKVVIILSGFFGASLPASVFNDVESWKALSWQEQAQCGTTLAKTMIDCVRQGPQEQELKPIFFWFITLADDVLNVYNSWVNRGDHEYYSVFWLLKDLCSAAHDFSQEISFQDLDLLDVCDNEQVLDEARAKMIFTKLSPLVHGSLALFLLMGKDDLSHKQRILCQGIKSLLRCGHWYCKNHEQEKHSLNTKLAWWCTMFNLGYLAKNMMTTYPENVAAQTTVPDKKLFRDAETNTDEVVIDAAAKKRNAKKSGHRKT